MMPRYMPRKPGQGQVDITNLDDPAYLRQAATIDKYVSIAKTKISSSKEQYIRGQDSILVPLELYEHLRQKSGGLISINMRQLVGIPDSKFVDDVIADVIARVIEDQVPKMYREQVRGALEKLKPEEQKYANTLEAAATALGVTLNPE
ncbi:MAG: hypothetical protein V1831_00960 [Candidatus Woesearchaeota archaeon]